MRIASAVIFLFLTLSVSAQTATDFTGHWRTQTDSGTERRLEIEQNGKNLIVKTVVTNSQGTRSVEVTYEISGRETTYKGLDGDEFHSSVRWEGKTLVFEIIEHEDGREVPQKTFWTLLDDGNTLEVERTLAKSGKAKQSSTKYVRQP